MKMGQLLKYALIIGGAYLAWRSGLFQALGFTFLPAPDDGTAAAAAVPAGGGGAAAVPPANTLTTTPTVTGGGGTAAAPQPAASVAPTSAGTYLTADQITQLVQNAAAGDVTAAAQATALGILYRGDQWNYFRAVQTGTSAPATPGLDQVMTAGQYLAYRLANGLSGISLSGVPLGAMRFWGARA